MTSNETLQLNPLETAEAIHSAGWRQGSVFLPSETLAIPFSFDPATEVLVILTQSCSVVSPRFNVDPYVEAIVARKLPVFREKAPEATGKNQRKLHIQLAAEALGCAALDCDINRRFIFDRLKLLEMTIHPVYSIENSGAKNLAAWIARHYTRIALPDELVKQMKKQLLPILENILIKDSMHSEVDRIYISWQISQSIRELFTLGFIFICRSQDVAQMLDQRLLQQLDPYLQPTNHQNIYIERLQCGTKKDLFLADLDGHERLSEWDYLTDLGELSRLINAT